MQNKGLIFGVLAAIVLMANFAMSDTGHEGAVRIENGSYGGTGFVAGSSTTGTAFVSDSVKRPAAVYINNTATAVWIGTTTATLDNGTHENIRIGFPLISSATIDMGSFTGTWYFTCNAGVAACEVRQMEGKVR